MAEMEMAVLPSFTNKKPDKLLMKKALYYDFMLFRRNQKPFNMFLVKSGLRSFMHSQVTVRYDDGLHAGLSSPSDFKPDENVNLNFILEKFQSLAAELDQSVFHPNTSEEIDQGIKTLVANLTPGAPFYNCSTDTVMSAIMAGRFDEFLSDENKKDMMRICYSGAADTVIPGMKGEEIELPKRMRVVTKAEFGGKNKRRKSKSKSKKTNKRSKRKSKSKKTNKRSKSKKGGASTTYVGSIQGEFINDRGQQLFRNPVGGIA